MDYVIGGNVMLDTVRFPGESIQTALCNVQM